MTPLPVVLDLVSVAVFAVTGALRASRARLDIVGFVFIAGIAAVGGGTVRDMLLGKDAVFWVDAPAFVAVSSAVALLMFFVAPFVEKRSVTLEWADAVALAVATAAGVLAAERAQEGPVIQVCMGVITGCFGGMLRDVVCNEVPLILRAGEIYVSAAFAGAVAMVGLAEVLPGTPWPLVAGAGTVLVLRAGSIALHWRLPVFRPRPPR